MKKQKEGNPDKMEIERIETKNLISTSKQTKGRHTINMPSRKLVISEVVNGIVFLKI